MSTPQAPLVPSFLRDKDLVPPLSQPPPPPETPFKIGPIVFRPRVSYSYSNAEGLPAADGQRITSEVHTVNASVAADLGEHWTLSYSPTWMYYASGALADSFDQSASISGAVAIRSLGVNFSESYSQSTPTLVETGQQTKQETWATSLGTAYSFSSAVQLQASAGVNERYTDIAADTRSWNSSLMLNLVLSPRLSLNLGPSFSYSEVAAAPDMYSENYTAQIGWHPTSRLNFSLSTGMQYSHSTSSAGLDLSNPLLNFNLSYQPFETTSLSCSASQTVSPSYFKEQVTKTFRWSVGVNQRLFGRVYLNAGYAPYNTGYAATDTLTVAGRKDSVKSYSAGLSTQLFGRLSISAHFSLNENKSNQSGFSFSTKQYGIQLGYSY